MNNKADIKSLEKEFLTTPKEEWPKLIRKFRRLYGVHIEKLLEKYRKKAAQYACEVKRLNEMKYYENQAYLDGAEYICGIDEVGRGPLAGPVVTAAVIMPREFLIEGINDSKKLSPAMRKDLFLKIRETAIDIKYGIIDNATIDSINILNATKRAMAESVFSLEIKPDILLIDALKLTDVDIRQFSIIKGDAKSVTIAAASIMAKVTRDEMMEEFDRIYPGYGFAQNKGYGTREHVEALKRLGPCALHRKSFIGSIVGNEVFTPELSDDAMEYNGLFDFADNSNEEVIL